jgi:HAD superfamily hydrolase (TIGR01509 family)
MTPAELAARTAWVFDLDGTLTVPMHDFAGLKRSLGLPADRDVLGGIALAPPAEQPRLHEAVRAWEREHVANAAAAPGADALLDQLVGRGCRIGILTRNTRETALSTLERIGLLDRFDPVCVLGRDSARPKPAPDGVRALLTRWSAPPDGSVMVGDYVDDLRAGRAAGAAAIWIDHEGTGVAASEASLTVRTLDALLGLVSRRSSFGPGRG